MIKKIDEKTVEELLEDISEVEKLLKAKEGNKKHLKKLLKNLYLELKVAMKKCKEEGHEFGEWETINTYQYHQFSYLPHGYQPVYYPLYVRKCTKCGYEEMRMNKPKEKTKNKKID